MFAEGIQLYTKVVSVFSHGNKLKFYYVMGWGESISNYLISYFVFRADEMTSIT